MDFPNVDERTDERFARLWPLVNENEKVREAAKAAPEMLKFSREGDGPHYRLYESRIPAGFDADKSFGSWATEEAKTAAMEESKAFRAGKEVGERQQRQSAEERYPQEVRYYPAMEAGEGKDRAAFNEIVSNIAKERDIPRKDIVQYNNQEGVKAFVSKIGPIPELAYWQSEEARGAWTKEGDKLKAQQDQSASRAADVVERAGLQAEGKTFQAMYGKGLALPPEKDASARKAVEGHIREASLEDLKVVQAATEREWKRLEKKQYAVQIEAAKAANSELSTQDFNKMKPDERRKAAGVEADKKFTVGDFTQMVRMRMGFNAINKDLQDRGVTLSVDQARELKGKTEAQEKKKPMGEKSQGLKQEEPAKEETASVGRKSSRGAAAAAALASNLGR